MLTVLLTPDWGIRFYCVLLMTIFIFLLNYSNLDYFRAYDFNLLVSQLMTAAILELDRILGSESIGDCSCFFWCRDVGGDLYIFCHVNEKPGIQRDGVNLYSKISIDYTEAILGTVVKVTIACSETSLEALCYTCISSLFGTLSILWISCTLELNENHFSLVFTVQLSFLMKIYYYL